MTTITFTEAREHRAAMVENWENRGYLILQKNGAVALAVRHQSAGTPSGEWNNVNTGFRIVNVGPRALTKFVNSEQTQTLLRRIHAGKVVAWDGHNHSGKFDADAQEAYEVLYSLLADFAFESQT